jgi:hypothetical protein
MGEAATINSWPDTAAFEINGWVAAGAWGTIMKTS